jgi:signal peptide peptidase SppA
VVFAEAHSGGTADDLPELVPPLRPRSYRHVLEALYERPWAIQPQMLTFMADLVRSRLNGGVLTQDEIVERLSVAAAENGPRDGSARAGSVAVIPMYGLISQRQSLMSDMSGGTSINEMRDALRSALADPEVKAIVFDIDSPGGSVDGVPEFAAELRAAGMGSKPVVGQVNTLAASAAYWLAANMTELVVTPSGEVGSIGVYAAHQDVSKAEEMAGVKTTLISAGPYKVEGNSLEPLTDEARSTIQEQVDEFYGNFLADVAKGRGVSVQMVADGYGSGRTMLAQKAHSAGMVDRIATLEDTVRRLQRVKTPAPAMTRAEVPAAVPITATRPDPAWIRRMKGRYK